MLRSKSGLLLVGLSFALISDLTVAQNLLLALHFVDIEEKEKLSRIDKILDGVKLLDLRDAPVNTMSGGEQQRVALARTILKPGNLILADEPTGCSSFTSLFPAAPTPRIA